MACSGSTGVVSRIKSLLEGIEKEELALTWRIPNFREVVEVALARAKSRVTQLRFFIGGEDGRVGADGGETSQPADSPHGLCSSPVPLLFFMTLQVSNDNDTSSIIRLDLSWDSRTTVRNSAGVRMELLSRCSGKICAGNKVTGRFHFGDIRKMTMGCPLGWVLFKMSEVDDHLDEEGSLSLKLFVTTYLTAGNNETVAFDQSDPTEAFALVNCREEALNDVGLLLGDDKTSDVQIVVFDGEMHADVFYCHTAILSARSPVFRAMFERDEMLERQIGVVKVVDVAPLVMLQFLTFLYTGRLNNQQKDGSVDETWLKMLPELVYVSDKYDLRDLKQYCEANLHRAVTKENAVEMLRLTRRHGLVKAEEKLRIDFAKNIDVLVESLLK